MRVVSLILVSFFTLASMAQTEEIHFKKTKQVVPKGDESEEKDVDLVFSEENKNIVIKHRKKSEVYAEIPYDSIKELTYERSTHPRTKTAIFVSPFALFSKGKKHWLTIQYESDGSSKFVLLRLDKKEYQRVVATLEAQTGIEVERLVES